jgi:uncharacterized protein
MILLDTTVLVYAVGTAHALRAPARTLMGAVADGNVRASTTVEVLQEFTHVRARRRDRADAAGLARDFATALTPLTTITADDLLAGLTLFERRHDVGAFDALLLAATQRCGARLVTADRQLVAAAPSHVLDLADPNLASLVRT